MKRDTFVKPPQAPGEWLIFECGCTYPAMMQAIIPGKPRKCLSCGSKCIGAVYTCMDCKKSFYRSPPNPRIKRCYECAYKNIRATSKQYTAYRTANSIPSHSDVIDVSSRKVKPKIWCSHYSDCLSKAVKANKQSVRCNGCERYDYAPLHAEVCSVGGSFTPTEFGRHSGRF